MLNPSTADDVLDDQTIRKCVGFSKRWGFSGLVVTNLFAFRATNPAEMKRFAGVNQNLAVGGAENQYHIGIAAAGADMVAVAWGTHGAFAGRAKAVMGSVLANVDLYCIGTTKDGHPKHPCMAGYMAEPVLFRAKLA